jgi:hypothetical protein
VLVYSVASRASLEICQTIYDKILDYGFTNVPCCLVGSKTDLANRSVPAATHAPVAVTSAFLQWAE